MYWKVIFIGLILLSSIQLTYAASERYTHYEITEMVNGTPVINVFTQEHGVTPYYTVEIGSKTSEYIMARLINAHDVNGLKVGYAVESGIEKYRFLWNDDSSDLLNKGNFGGIGFYETNYSIVLEVFENKMSASKKEISLNFSQMNSSQKIKFDFIIASLVDYYVNNLDNQQAGGISVITNGMGKNIGIRINKSQP
jgi:hypothetical protein